MAQVNPREALRLLPEDYRTVEVENVPDTRTPEEMAEDQAISFQAMTEGVDVVREGRTLARKVFLRTRYQHAPEAHRTGRMFRIADRIGLMPLAEFAYHANSGMDTGDIGALAAIYEMLQDCIHPDDWAAFRRYAKEIKADTEDLMDTVNQTVELLTANPTGKESDFSQPSPRTSDSLTESYSNPAAKDLISVPELIQRASSA